MKVYVPAERLSIVVEPPLPDFVAPPGEMVIVQSPTVGRPLNGTLPVEMKHVGCIIVPITGAVGNDTTVMVTSGVLTGPQTPLDISQ